MFIFRLSSVELNETERNSCEYVEYFMKRSNIFYYDLQTLLFPTINTSDRQCRIKSFFIYQGASSILFTLQSCEECSEGNRTKKKKVEKKTRSIYNRIYTNKRGPE